MTTKSNTKARIPRTRSDCHRVASGYGGGFGYTAGFHGGYGYGYGDSSGTGFAQGSSFGAGIQMNNQKN